LLAPVRVPPRLVVGDISEELLVKFLHIKIEASFVRADLHVDHPSANGMLAGTK
jgi:hypothetical protein